MRISSPTYPSPLGESMSSQQLSELKHEMKSPSESCRSFSTRSFEPIKEIEKRLEEETEDNSSIDTSIYRPEQTRHMCLQNDNDGQASEIFSDGNHQRVETNSKVSNNDNLSYIIDVEDYAS